MPYKTIRELPIHIRELLPESAQKFYWIAYNSALQWYGEEEKAHQIAWSAVRSQAVSLNSLIEQNL